MSYSTFDAADFVDDSATQRAIAKSKAPSQVTQDMANRASAIVKKYPTISKGSLVGAVKLGISDEDPRLRQIVLQESIAKEREGFGALKSAIGDKAKSMSRGLFLGFQNLWEAGAARGVRYLEGRQQGMSHKEAKGKSKSSLLDMKAQAEAEGREVDLGTGWFLGSTDPTQTDEYKNLVQSGVDPVEAREFVLDNVLGVQIYEEQRKKAETAIQFTGERAERFEEAGLNPTVTIGRWLFKPLDDIIEPGTTAYKNITGTLDILAQVFLDPVGMAALGVGKARAGAKTFTELENLSTMGKLFENTGLLQGARKSIFGPTTKEFLSGKAGLKFKKFLWETDTTDIIAASKNNIDDLDFYVRLDDFKAAHKGKSFDAIDKKLTDELITDHFLVQATKNNLPTVNRKGNRLTGMLEKSYGTRIVTKNKNDSLVQLNRYIRLATSSLDDTKKLTERNKFMKEAMKALNSKDAPSDVARLIVKHLEGKDGFRKQVIKKLGGEDNLTKWQKSLVDEGLKVQAGFISGAKKIRLDVRSYAIETGGTDIPITGVLNKLQKGKLDGVENLMDPLVVTQLADEIFLPNPTKLLRAAKALDDDLGRIGTKLLASDNVDSVRRFMDWYYGSLFKPLVLLRPAWTVRVIAEEQLRMVTSGVTNVISHPGELIARMIGKPKESSKNLIGSFEDNAQFIDGTLNGMNPGAIRRGTSTGEWTTISKHENSKAWGENAFRNFMQHKFDPLSRRLAQIQLEPSAAKRTRELNKLIKEVQTTGNSLNKHIRKVTGAKGHAFNGAGLSSKPGAAKAEEFVYYVNAAVAQVTGGIVETGAAKGSKYGKMRKAKNWIDENGKEDLLKALGDETMSADELVGLEKIDMKKYWGGDLSPQEYDSISTQLMKNQENLKKSFIKKYKKLLPENVRGELKTGAAKRTGWLDDFTDDMFKLLMTVPTKNLSRAPTFKYHYWDKVGDFAQHANKTTLNKMIKQAKEAGLETGTRHEKKILKKLESYKGVDGGINKVEIVDKMASSHALTETKKLLYDVTTRSRIGNATRGIFPFGEAYVEIFTTWARLIRTEQLRPLRRAQQVVQAARKPNPVFDEEGQQGFFYKDPNTGEELFGYPGEGLANKWMFKDLNEGGVGVNLPVFASSLNIAGNLIPGFGPTVTVPMALINQKFNLLRPGKWEETLLFGDFAPPRTGSATEILGSLAPTPSWAKKLGTAFGIGGDESKRLFSNTMIDVYKAMLYAGIADDSTPEGASAAMELAGDYARNIFLIRAASQFIGPSGAVSPKYEISDKTGNVFLFETLAEEYRLIKNSSPNDYEAMKTFTDRFGFNPIALTTSRTDTIKKRPVTEDGARWARNNKELVDKYDLTYAYLIDDTDSEFRYELYWQQLIDKDRVPRTPEQWQQAKNILLGNMEYEEFIRKNGLLTRGDRVSNQAKLNKKAELVGKYPGYGRSIDYSMQKPEMDDLIDELYTWFDPVTYQLERDLVTNPAAQALVEYAKTRDSIIATTKRLDPTYTDTSFRRASKLAPFRNLLRDKLKAILVRYPEFAPMAREIFERELREADEDIELVQGLYDS